MLDWGLPAADAIALPNIFFDKQGLTIEGNDMGNALAPQVAKLGPARAADVPVEGHGDPEHARGLARRRRSAEHRDRGKRMTRHGGKRRPGGET